MFIKILALYSFLQDTANRHRQGHRQMHGLRLSRGFAASCTRTVIEHDVTGVSQISGLSANKDQQPLVRFKEYLELLWCSYVRTKTFSDLGMS